MTLQAMVCVVSVVRCLRTYVSQDTSVVVARPDDSSDVDVKACDHTEGLQLR